MPTKKELLAIISAYGLGRVLPAGSTRAATTRVLGTLVKGGRVVAPVVARGATMTPVGRAATAAALGYGAYRAGAFDDPMARLEALERRLDEPLMDPIPTGPTTFEAPIERFRFPRRKKSAFNKMVSAGMKTVKASTSYGSKGKISNAKKAFSAVTKAASAVSKGKKLPKSGIKRKLMSVMRRFR
jgi:hypothetical protein